jgi:hypothetical protein
VRWEGGRGLGVIMLSLYNGNASLTGRELGGGEPQLPMALVDINRCEGRSKLANRGGRLKNIIYQLVMGMRVD